MKRIDEKGWEEIGRFARAMRDAKCGGIDIVMEASSLAELIDELEAMKAERVKKEKRNHHGRAAQKKEGE